MARYETIRFNLKISRSKYLRYYDGTIGWIQVTALDGRRVRFPASALRRFVTDEGIDGTFEIMIDENRKMVSIRRIGS